MVNVGDVIYQSYDDTPSSTISIGGSGINQTWDYSALQSSINDTLFFVQPSLTVFDSLYSNVNLSMIGSGSISYFNFFSVTLTAFFFFNFIGSSSAVSFVLFLS